MVERIIKQKTNKLQSIPLQHIFLESHIENMVEDMKKQIFIRTDDSVLAMHLGESTNVCNMSPFMVLARFYFNSYIPE